MSSGGPGRDETLEQRDDRNLAELLQELRVAGLGVQVLFGFLLSLPFDQRFVHVDGPRKSIYLASLLCAAAAVLFLTAPVAFHRLLFRRHEKERLVKIANTLSIAGLAMVALAVAFAVWLVVGQVETGAGVAVAVVATFVAFSCTWFVLPLLTRSQKGHR